MLKKLMTSALIACLLLGTLQAKSLREVLGASLDQMNEGVTELDLADKGITEITLQEGVLLATNYPNLEKLDLSDNQLSSLPAEIGQLANLKELFLTDNKLTSLPTEIGKLAKLERLWL